jgi:uncharacterized protein
MRITARHRQGHWSPISGSGVPTVRTAGVYVIPTLAAYRPPCDPPSRPENLPGLAGDGEHRSRRVGDGGRARHDRPVNFVVDADTIVFSTSEGEKLDAVREGRTLTFEVDEVELALQAGWSVLAVGSAEVIISPAQIHRIEQLHLAPWVASPGRVFVRLLASEVTGRRLPVHPGKITIVRTEPGIQVHMHP